MTQRKSKIERFNENVLSKFQLYNSVFTTLPFKEITGTGMLLPLFNELNDNGFTNKKTPVEIVETFFSKYLEKSTSKEQIDMLFRFIQYIERQVVLFDAIEEASFNIVNNMDGRGTLRNLKEEAQSKNILKELQARLNTFKIRVVLTAHPTQFYPGAILGIITDLAVAIENNNLNDVRLLLAQLGKTPFFNKEKPTPFDEAVSLIWYLENVFYHSATSIVNYIQGSILTTEEFRNKQIIQLGFWPGGDRDGNPYVTTKITKKVAKRLHKTILKNYYRDIRKLKRKITFRGLTTLLSSLEYKLYEHTFDDKPKTSLSISEIIEALERTKEELITEHQSLYVTEVTDLLNKVYLFGFHFANLDIRQDSRIHTAVLQKIIEETPKLNEFKPYIQESDINTKLALLDKMRVQLEPKNYKDKITRKTLASIYAMQQIQKTNGEAGCNKYIISNTQSEVNVMEVFTLCKLCNWNTPTVDIIPLFETVDDLQNAHFIMEKLYSNATYKEHLQQRKNTQTIMLGFSDGTKDGGYLMANWSIYQAKEQLTSISRKYNIHVIFFDGRGGPPSRGGGKTHQFYASLGPTIENEEVQLTIQGQTISSNFGTVDASQYNMEQLLSSGISNKIFDPEKNALDGNDKATMTELAQLSYKAYSEFKNHPKFLPYLEHMSTLKYYGKANIGSRPSKREKNSELVFSDLRAIPFVGSWNQLKQNVPGFYGVGYAIEQMEKAGKLQQVKILYKNSAFFRTLIENSMMSLTKSFFELTAYMEKDKVFGDFWRLIFDEYNRSKEMVLKVSGFNELMEESLAMKASIDIREKIIRPLLTIQQYALLRINELKKNPKENKETIKVYEKMITRTLFGNINASRNSA